MLAIFLGYFFIKKIIYPKKYQSQIEYYSNKYNIDANLIYAVCKVESKFNKNAVSSRGAIGIMQITPKTADYIAKQLNVKEYNVFDAETNLNFGTYYLRYLINRFNNIETSICAYNAGEGTVKSWLNNKNYSVDSKTLNKIPYAETENYKNKVLKAYKMYNIIYK